jgi:ABC-type transport system involved in multi-copper enzyme maturation permease subunit
LNAIYNIAIIGRVTMLEGARKQVFHVLVLVAMFLIFSSAILARFDQHVQMKMLSDLALFSILLVSSIIAITISVTGLPGEMEQKTIYPVIAKPVTRAQFLLGKYAGAMATTAIGMVLMTVTFAFLEFYYMGHVDRALLIVVPFLWLETGILAALALCLSTVCSWPLAWFMSILIWMAGNAKFTLYQSLMSRNPPAFNKVTITTMFHLLPNLQCFNFMDAVVHHLTVPPSYLGQTAVYGVSYIAAVLIVSSMLFARREL